MSRTKEELDQQLAVHGQEHLLAFWHQLDAPARAQLAEQIERLDLPQLDALYRQQVEAEDWAACARRAQGPPAKRLSDDAADPSSLLADQAGLDALAAGQVAVVIVAGGQGSRLGFEHPKGMYPIGPVSNSTLFQILLEKIAARSRVAGMRIPLYLMTSPATHDETLRYLAECEKFGLPGEDVIVFCQGTMPAVDASSGSLLLAEKHSLALSPDGHGGTLSALVANHCLEDMHARGIRQVFYCQVDNPLVEMCDPRFIGCHKLANSEVSTLVIAKRQARERVGNVVAIDGRARILEYSDLNPLEDEIVHRHGPDGSPVFWAGNTACHVFDLAFLDRMARSNSALPFHIARKAVPFVDSQGKRVEPSEPNAIKFERFIFDLLPEAEHTIVVEVDPRTTFAPVKNAPGEAFDSPETVREQMIALHASWLRAAGCEVAEGVAVEISPLFAQNAQEVAAQIRPGMAVTAARYFC